MTNKFIAIQDAADLSGKSIQTIRRAIKAKKVKFKKKNTPQGFNYVVDRDSICEFFKIKPETDVKKEEQVKESSVRAETRQVSDNVAVSSEDLKSLTRALEKMIAQHSEERQSFMRLVNTMQEKVFMLENQINLLKAPQKKWFAFWK